jgi:hypothetical protein
MQTISKNKIAIAISVFMILSMSASMLIAPGVLAQVNQVPGTHIPTYARLNVFPLIVGVGQSITVNYYVATPLETSGTPTNFTIVIVPPVGDNITYPGLKGDTTGGSVMYYTPTMVGNYTFQNYYLGEPLGTASSGAGSYINDPSTSKPMTVQVQEEPVLPGAAFPFTPLPTQWWQTPVSAANSQNWYAITGAWLGLGFTTFAASGEYNCSSFYNPYTEDVLAGHVLWSTPWLVGGVAGGDFGGGQDMGHFWSTFQYTPRYAPVVMNGILYSTWYTFAASAGANQGIRALDLYTGKTLWVINTTSVLRCGMQFYTKTVNAYGVRGPWIWTTGTLNPSETGGSTPSNSTGVQWNLYDAMTGKYVMSLVNGTASSLTAVGGMNLATDDQGNIIGYFLNSTAGTQRIAGNARFGTNQIVTNTGPHVTMVNMTQAIGATGDWAPGSNTFRAMQTGYVWDMPAPTNISGVPISPALAINVITGNELVMTGGFIRGQGFGQEQAGWLVFAAMDKDTGEILHATNLTYTGGDKSFLPFTRVSDRSFGCGMFVNLNLVDLSVAGYRTVDGSKAWETKLTGDNGADGNPYNNFGIKTNIGPGVIVWSGFGGDIWCQNFTTGEVLWYTNTTKLVGSSGLETPYNIWPLWSFQSGCGSNGVQYLAVGHEYDPPLFRGCRLIAVNVTDGSHIWSTLSTSVESTVIAYGKLVTLNAYDNMLYCFGKGPSTMTIAAPSIGVTTSTPITITGTIMDASPGTRDIVSPTQTETKQNEVALRFPSGLPCVSDESQSLFMEYVYQQQPLYNNMTGVPITISVIDSNNNFRDIGTTTSESTGTYAFTWTPDISGDYRVIATFAGSNSYYPSSADTHFFAGETPTHEPVVTPISNAATPADLLTYLAAGVIAIIIAIAIVGLLIIRTVRKP